MEKVFARTLTGNPVLPYSREAGYTADDCMV